MLGECSFFVQISQKKEGKLHSSLSRLLEQGYGQKDHLKQKEWTQRSVI